MNASQPATREEVIASAWREQGIWSEVANRMKRELNEWRNRAAIAGVGGAFLATLSAALQGSDDLRWLSAALALVAAVILAVVPYVSRTKASADRVREWVRARSASEALKEEIYRYLVGAPPYEPDSTPAVLIEHRRAIEDDVNDLNIHAAEVDLPEKRRPLSLTIENYIDMRINDQVDTYYLPKGRANARVAKRFRDFEFALGMVAVVLAAMAGATAATGWEWLNSLGSWVAVATTAVAAVTTHREAARYDHQALTFFATARQLVHLRDQWRTESDRLNPARVAKLVDDAENAISKENDAWLAKWTSADTGRSST